MSHRFPPRRAVVWSALALAACCAVQQAQAAEVIEKQEKNPSSTPKSAPRAAPSPTASDEAEISLALDEITVSAAADAISASAATRVSASAMQTPFSVTAVDSKLIENSSATSLSDVMRYAATVGGTDNFGNAGEFFSSRGFQLAAGKNYFRDGLRYRKYGQVPLYDIERIEVLRGPASVLYGALEPGGVINIVSRQPSRTFGAAARLRLGQHRYRQGTLDVTGPLGERASYRVQALSSQGHSFRDVVSGKSKGMSGQLNLPLMADTLLTLRASVYADERTGDRGTVLAVQPDGSVGFANVPRSRFLGEPYARFRFEDTQLSANLHHQINAQWLLRADLVHSRQREDRVYLWFPTDNKPIGPSGLMNRQVGDWHARLRGGLGRIEAVGEFAALGWQHRLLAGAEFERFTNRRSNERYQGAPINIYRPIYTPQRPPNGRRIASAPFADRFDSKSLYLQDLMQWRSALSVLAGLRYDWVDARDPDRHQARERFKGLTPQLGIVFHPADWLSPYLSHTRSFVPQSGADRHGKRFAPQKSRQWEAGVKFNLPEAKTFITLAAYRLEKNNLKMADPDDPQYSRLSGLRRSQGLEAALHTRPLPGLDLSANYAWTAKARFIRDDRFAGHTSANVPRHALGLFADYRFTGAWARLSASLGLSYVGQRQGNDLNSFRLPAYTLTDLSLRWRASENATVTLNVKNLFDRRYYTGAINTTTIGVGAPRQLFVGLEWRM